MAISAEFESWCPACHRRISPGDAIEASPEGPYVHVTCLPAGEPSYKPLADTSPLCPECFLHHRGECF